MGRVESKRRLPFVRSGEYPLTDIDTFFGVFGAIWFVTIRILPRGAATLLGWQTGCPPEDPGDEWKSGVLLRRAPVASSAITRLVWVSKILILPVKDCSRRGFSRILARNTSPWDMAVAFNAADSAISSRILSDEDAETAPGVRV